MNETSGIPSRSQRRMAMKHQGLLKQKRNLSLLDWTKLCKEIRAKGNEIQEANAERCENIAFAKLEEIEASKMLAWKTEGYNDKEIEKLREAYSIMAVKNKDTWKTDKKIARNIIKEARLSLQKRS